MSTNANETIGKLKAVTPFTKKGDMEKVIKEAVSVLEELSASKLDPAGAAEAKRTLEMLQRVDNLKPEDVRAEVDGVLSYLVDSLRKVTETTLARLTELNEVNASVTLKRAELKEVYGVEEQLQKLVALINANEKVKQEFDATHGAKVVEAENRVKELTAEISGLEAELKEKRTVAEKAMNAEIERQRKEHEYAFGREKLKAKDDLTDELAKQRKAHDETIATEKASLASWEKTLSDKEVDLNKRSEHLSDLEAKVADIPNVIAGAVAKAKASVEKEVEAKVEAQVALVKTQVEADLRIEKAKNEHLTARNAELTQQNADLQERLNAAYGNVQAVALETVRTANANKTLDKVAGMVGNATNDQRKA